MWNKRVNLIQSKTAHFASRLCFGLWNHIFSDIFGASKLGAVGAVRAERQTMVVDSLMLVTRGVPKKRNNRDDEKDYFVVWRRVEPGTFSKQR